jgi:hypothetical protein
MFHVILYRVQHQFHAIHITASDGTAWCHSLLWYNDTLHMAATTLNGTLSIPLRGCEMILSFVKTDALKVSITCHEFDTKCDVIFAGDVINTV